MSQTYSIACTQCEVQLWIGQTRVPLYSGQPNTLAQLARFLIAHEDHPLIYCDDDKLGYDEFEKLDQRDWEEVAALMRAPIRRNITGVLRGGRGSTQLRPGVPGSRGEV